MGEQEPFAVVVCDINAFCVLPEMPVPVDECLFSNDDEIARRFVMLV